MRWRRRRLMTPLLLPMLTMMVMVFPWRWTRTPPPTTNIVHTSIPIKTSFIATLQRHAETKPQSNIITHLAQHGRHFKGVSKRSTEGPLIVGRVRVCVNLHCCHCSWRGRPCSVVSSCVRCSIVINVRRWTPLGSSCRFTRSNSHRRQACSRLGWWTPSSWRRSSIAVVSTSTACSSVAASTRGGATVIVVVAAAATMMHGDTDWTAATTSTGGDYRRGRCCPSCCVRWWWWCRGRERHIVNSTHITHYKCRRDHFTGIVG